MDARDIGLSLNSNTGINTVEEGSMSDGGGRIELSLKWAFAIPGVEKPSFGTRTWDVVGKITAKSAANSDSVPSLSLSGDTLTESLSLDYPSGRRVSSFKTYRRSFNYLEPQLKGSHGGPQITEVRKSGFGSSSSTGSARSSASTDCGSQYTWVWDEVAYDWVKSCPGQSRSAPAPAATSTWTTSTPAPHGNWRRVLSL